MVHTKAWRQTFQTGLNSPTEMLGFPLIDAKAVPETSDEDDHVQESLQKGSYNRAMDKEMIISFWPPVAHNRYIWR